MTFTAGQSGHIAESNRVAAVLESLPATYAEKVATDAAIAALPATYAASASLVPPPGMPLVLPTDDDDPSVTHPTVVAAPSGVWNGFRLWMAYTPYPAVARENPHVVASNDGVNWTEPAGIVNPVVPYSFALAQGYQYNSDPELVFIGSTLVMFFRTASEGGTVNEAIFRTTSTDGATWTTPVKVIDGPTTNNVMVSPAVVREDDGTLKMWVVNEAVTNAAAFAYRTSADGGLTWTAPVAQAAPVGQNPWHVAVQKVSGIYYALVYSKGHKTLTMGSSPDGIAWSDDGGYEFPRSGFTWDNTDFYRSTFLPVPGEPLAWDLWIAGTDAAGVRRISYYRAVDWAGRAAAERARRAQAVITRSDLYTVVDGFDRLDWRGIGKPDLGPATGWVRQFPGQSLTENVVAGRIALPVVGGPYAGANLTIAATADTIVQADVVISDQGAGTDVGLIVRHINPANFLVLGITRSAGTNRVRLNKWYHATNIIPPTDSTQLAENTAAGLPLVGVCRVTVKTSVAVVTVSVNDVVVLTHTLVAGDQTIYGAATGVGLYAWNDNRTRFDNFSARSLPY